MNKKIIALLLLSFVFTTGFTTQYSLNINDDKIEENIKINVSNQELDNVNNTNSDIEIDDQITPMFNLDYYPFANNNDIKYNKKIVDTDTGKMIILDYTYEIKDFVNSRYFGSCYNNNNSLFTDSGYTLDISGRFYCYYGDSIDISVITKDKVIDENADEVKAHTYTWHLDSADYNNQQILLEVEYDNSIPVWIIYGSIVIVGIIVIIFMMYFILKNRFNNAI